MPLCPALNRSVGVAPTEISSRAMPDAPACVAEAGERLGFPLGDRAQVVFRGGVIRVAGVAEQPAQLQARQRRDGRMKASGSAWGSIPHR